MYVSISICVMFSCKYNKQSTITQNGFTYLNNIDTIWESLVKLVSFHFIWSTGAFFLRQRHYKTYLTNEGKNLI